MPDNLVNIVFQAETAQLTQAFAKVNSELGSLSSATYAADQKARQSAYAVQLAAKQSAQELDAAAKQAAHFGNASQEAGEKATKAHESAGRSLKQQVADVRSLYYNVAAAVGVVYTLAKAWEAAAAAEAASRHLSAQTSPTISKEIGAAAKALNYSPAEYQDLALPLKVAGIHANNLKEIVTRIGEASRVSGVPVQALEQMIEKVQTGGHATWSDMKTLTLATDGATQHLADTFRTMAVNQLEYEQKFKAISESNRKVIQDRQQKIAGQDAFAEKIGVGDSSFKAYIARGGFAGGPGSSYADQLEAGRARVAEQQRPRSYAELWGQTSEKGLARQEDKRYTEGIAQLAKEGDSTRSAVLNYIKAGKFDRSDVLSAAGRSRSEAEQDRQLEERKTQEKESSDYEKAQRDLLVKGLNDFLLKATPAKTAEVAAQKSTPEGQWQHVSATVGDMKVTVGRALIAYTNAVVTAEPLQAVAGAVQTALPNAARDQVAQRLKEGGLDYDTIIPKYGPGQAVPGRVPGPTSKEGGKVEDPTTHGLLEQLLAIFRGGG